MSSLQVRRTFYKKVRRTFWFKTLHVVLTTGQDFVTIATFGTNSLTTGERLEPVVFLRMTHAN